MDPISTNTSQETIAPINEPAKITVHKRKRYLIIAGIALLCIVIFLGIFLMKKSYEKNMNSAKNNVITDNDATEQTLDKKPQNAIAKVGNEYIYQSDLDKELSYFGETKDEETKKMLLEKLVKDSIILQAAQKNKLITLSDTVYNSSNKDYMKRIKEIKNIQEKIDSQLDQISGTMVSVWFNNQIPATIGVAEGKKEALKRITALRERVISKEISIEDAGRLISTDTSYATLDPGAYQNNALIPFSYPKGEQITTDPEFDTILWDTKEGAVTPIFLGKDLDNTGKKTEMYYIFGQVKKKMNKGNTMDISEWYDSQKNNYAVTNY